MKVKKLKTLQNLKKILHKLKKKQQRVVFSNGCFDILHIGHVRYLKKAKTYGDILVVGVNSDSSVKKIKGRNRPIIPVRERVEILSALYFIDYLIIFSQTTPIKVIEALKPDVLVKGSDYKINEIVGGEFVESIGGKVVNIPLVKAKSTTALIKKIVTNFGNRKL